MKHPTASADLAGIRHRWRGSEMLVIEGVDPRKPWTEPTVTECATTNRRPATLTIAGVDLPNPPAQPSIAQLLHDLEKNAKWIGGDDAWGNVDWKAGPKGLDGKGYAADMRAAIDEIQRQAAVIDELSKPRVPTQTDNGELYFDQLVSEIPADWSSQGYISRMHEVTDMAAVGRSLIGVIAEITRPGATVNCLEGWPAADDPVEIVGDLLNKIHDRDAEITELQGMLEEAIGPVRLVSDLANMSDVECDNSSAYDLRTWARGKLNGDFTMPRLYDGADRKRAVEAVLADRPKTNPLLAMEVVDIVAAALGLRRAS